MMEDIRSPIAEKQKLQNDVNNSLSITPVSDDSLQLQTKNLQNYSQFRSAKYQPIHNHSDKLHPINQKLKNRFPPSFSYSYMRKKTNIDNGQTTQEYCRYRNAIHLTPAKMSILPKMQLSSACYSKLTNQNENEYSRFRDSRCLRKNSTSQYNNKHLKPHTKCRSLDYDKNQQRFPVPDDRISWDTIFPDYMPFEYTTEKVQRNPKADPCDPSKIEKFNDVDKKIDRRSFTGQYLVDPVTHRPRNPVGRTGITGRGRLYYWGPNHAGDPVVTRWLRNEDGSIVQRRNHTYDQLKPVLEFVSILRHDTKQWALPGGMVDPGEQVSETVKREFQEEAARDGIDQNCIKELFSNGHKLFESYVDDPRNTDNAWMETVAMNFHDETGELTKHLHLHAGDDAEKVVWHPIDGKLQLYACHKTIVKEVVDRLDAFW